MKRKKRIIASFISTSMILQCAITPNIAFSNYLFENEIKPTYTIKTEPATENVQQSSSNNVEVEQNSAEQSNVLPPLMGWSTWNAFREQIDENKIREVADVMVSSGIAEAGYKYLNFDDCWQSNLRDPQTQSMMWDYDNFPSGPDLIDDLHNEGLKVGLYSSASKLTCEDLTASYGYEKEDAKAFAEWGIDFLKYDYCHVEDPGMSMDLGWADLKIAPEVDYISVSPVNDADRNGIPKHYQAENAELKGNAQIVDDQAGNNGNICEGGKYVTGLNANGGKIIFNNVNVPKAGEYILTIGFNKTNSPKGKFAQIVVNDTNKYDTHIAQTSGWSATGRQQVIVNLNAGDNKIMIHNPVDTQKNDNIRRYGKMGDELKKAVTEVAEQTQQPERPIYYSICEHGRTEPWTWAGDYGNSWRSSHDIWANWESIMTCYESSVTKVDYQKPGAYNDPDMMQVGNGNLTEEENRSHFTLWAMLSAPLVLGNDVRIFADMTSDTPEAKKAKQIFDIVTNKELIAINQDLPLLQCKRVSSQNNIDILVKPLQNQETKAPEVAICFLNKSNTPQSSSIDINSLVDDRADLPKGDLYLTKDLWNTSNTNITDNTLNSGEIPPHGVKVYRVSVADDSSIEKLPFVNIETKDIYAANKTAEVVVKVSNKGNKTINSATVELNTFDGKEPQTLEINQPIKKGEVAEVKFTVSIPAVSNDDNNNKSDIKNLSAKVSCNYEGDLEATVKTVDKSVRVAEAVSGETVKLNNSAWVSSNTGWGQIKRNKSVDGNTITINGTEYNEGIGVHANSEIKIFLDKQPYKFSAVVGVDDEVTDSTQWKSSVIFEVVADNEVIAQSDKLSKGQSYEFKDIDLSAEYDVLTLRASDAGDGNSNDHADWANPILTATEGSQIGELDKVEVSVPNLIVEGETYDITVVGKSKDGSVIPTNSTVVEYKLTNGDGKATVKDGKLIAESKGNISLVVDMTYKEKTVSSNKLDIKISPKGTIADEISHFDNIEVYTLPNKPPQLPSKVTAVYFNGDKKEIDVKWGNISPDLYKNVNQFEIYGTINEKSPKNPSAKIKVVEPVAAQNVSMVIAEGEEIILPKRATVYLSDGSTIKGDVVWEVEKIRGLSEGIKNYNGTVLYLDKKLPITAKVRTTSEKENSNYVVQQIGYNLPVGIASNTDINSIYSAKYLNDGKIFTTNEDIKIWSNKGKSTNEDWISANIAVSGIPVKKTVNKVKFGLINEGNTDIPIMLPEIIDKPTILPELPDESNKPTILPELPDKSDKPTVLPELPDESDKPTVLPEIIDNGISILNENINKIEAPENIDLISANNTINENIALPTNYYVEYYTGPLDYELDIDSLQNEKVAELGENHPLNNDKNWQEVTYTGSKPAIPNNQDFRNEIEVNFEPVETNLIRVRMQGQQGKAIGVDEFEVYGNSAVANKDFEVTKIEIDGKDRLKDFVDNTLNYELNKDSEIPTVSVEVTNNASVTIIPPSIYNKEMQIKIVPENGLETGVKTYKIVFTGEGVFEPIEAISVEFQTNSNTNITTSYIVKGSRVDKPKDPVKSGYSFAGWYLDSELNQNFDFSNPINENITLYAKWTRNSSSGGSDDTSSDNSYKYEQPKNNKEFSVNDIIDISNNNKFSVKLNDNEKVNISIEKNNDKEFKVIFEQNGKNLNSVNKEIKFSIPVNEKGLGTVAVLVDENGNEKIIKKSYLKNENLIIPLSSAGTIKITDNSINFKDVNNSSWFKNSIDFVTSRNLFVGTSETEFSPNTNMNRAMVATILYRLENEPKVNNINSFEDININSYYSNAVAWASQNNYVAGITESLFAPDEPVTREQLVTILYRYNNSPNVSDNNIAKFTDNEEISVWAKDAINWAVNEKIISGRIDGTLDPKGYATRAEVATIFMYMIMR